MSLIMIWTTEAGVRYDRSVRVEIVSPCSVNELHMHPCEREAVYI